MPNIVGELAETYTSVTRPVINQIVKHLIQVMRLPPDTAVEFFGATESQSQPQSTLTEGVQNKFPFYGKVSVEANEQYIEDRTLTTAVKKYNDLQYFQDGALAVQIKPVYVACEVTLSFRFRAKDRTTSERWRDELRVRSSQGRAELLHEFDYHLNVPKEFLVILHEIHRLRENVAGYGESLTDWLKAGLTKRATTLTTQAGTHPVLTIAEHQVGIIGWFEFISQPESGAKAGEGSPWETGFDYKFQYDKPVASVMNYPIIIHNQLLGPEYRQSEPVYQLINRARRPSNERGLMDYFSELYKTKAQPLADNRLPDWDDWVPESENPNFSSLLTMLVGVGDDPTELINLNELDEYELTPKMLEFIKTEWRWMTSIYQSVFYVSLYKWNRPVPDTSVTLDTLGNFVSKIPLSERDAWHVRISMVNELSLLSKEALDRLRKNGELCLEIIRALYPTVKLPELIGGQLVGWDDLINIIGGQNDNVSIRTRFANRRTFKTVGTFGIIAKKVIS